MYRAMALRGVLSFSIDNDKRAGVPMRCHCTVRRPYAGGALPPYEHIHYSIYVILPCEYMRAFLSAKILHIPI